MVASCKCFDGWDLGLYKVGEDSGEREGKFGNVSAPPQPTPRDNFASKPNHLLKSKEKPSEKINEKPSEKPCGKPSEQPCEEPHPKPKPKLVRFHCGYCGRDDHKDGFCFKRKRGERMEEWANKGKYHPSDGVLEPRVQMPRAKASVKTVRAWGERKAVGGAAAQATPVRPVRGTGQTGAGLDRQQFGFVLVQMRGLFLVVVVLVVGLESVQEVRLLGTLPLEFTTGMGGVVALRRRGGTVHRLSFMVWVHLQAERVGSLMVVTVVVFVEVALVGKMAWFVLTPLSSNWLSTGSTLLVLTPVEEYLGPLSGFW
jgi:uncharacterized membrane protein